MVPSDNRDAETPILKDEPILPKILDNPINIFNQKKTNDAGMIGRASMKGFMKEELDDFN